MKLSRLARLIAIVAVLIIPMESFAADGAAIFKGKCATCHGADGSGNTPMGKTLKIKDLGSAEVQKADIQKSITDGKGKMPAYKGKLTDDEIKAVAAFVKTLKK